MSTPGAATPPGWYPIGPGVLRYWDGNVWTDHHHSVAPTNHRWASAVAHLGFFVLPVVVPLVILRTTGKSDPEVKAHATSALNFQGTLLIVWIPLFAWFFASHALGAPGPGPATAAYLAFILVALIPTVVGAVRSLRGRSWRYGIAIPFVR